MKSLLTALIFALLPLASFADTRLLFPEIPQFNFETIQTFEGEVYTQADSSTNNWFQMDPESGDILVGQSKTEDYLTDASIGVKVAAGKSLYITDLPTVYNVWTIQSDDRVFTNVFTDVNEWWLVDSDDVMRKIPGSNRSYTAEYLQAALDAVPVEPGQTLEEARIANAPDVSDWDYFWGTTLHPQNTGWDDFWYQCQDESKTAGDCVGTVFAGVGFALAGAAVVAVLVAGAVTVGVVLAPQIVLYADIIGIITIA